MAATFYFSCIMEANECIICLSHANTNKHTKLRLFSQCLLQKLLHFLPSDILYILPTNAPNPNWEEWNGP